MTASILATLVTLNAAVFALLVFARARRKEVRGQRSERAPEDLREATHATSHSPPATRHPPPACAVCGEVHATQPLPALILRDAACPHCAIVQPVPRVLGDQKPRPWACIQCGGVMAVEPNHSVRKPTDAEVDECRRNLGPAMWAVVEAKQGFYRRRRMDHSRRGFTSRN